MKILTIVAAASFLAVVAAKHPFVSNGIVPDLIDSPPRACMKVVYPAGQVHYGNKFTPTQVKSFPQLSFPTERRALYSVMLVDPDAPSRQNHTFRSFAHFFAGNVPSSLNLNGTGVVDFFGSAPEKDTDDQQCILKCVLPGCDWLRPTKYPDQPLGSRSPGGRSQNFVGDTQSQPGYHRYVWLAYKQPGYIDFNSKWMETL